ncbi:PepSY1/2 domain-containing protein [Paenibacillus sp. YAF4_2]|uniref:PepSY1/2 domain-containing protein n=1 Tax=Paenibacillus sp. YAF4_2 TaxID=3233085 RepID=UPI003F9D1E92
MNQARMYKIISIILALGLIGFMMYGHSLHKQLNEYEKEKLQDTRTWVHMQMMYTEVLDRELANVLASNSSSYYKKYLKSAYDTASYMTKSSSFNPPSAVFSDFQFNYAESFWREAASYLGYLADDEADTLTEVQRQNLLEMRNYTLKTIPVMHQMFKDVLFAPHVTEVPSEELSQILTPLTNDIKPYLSFGDEEPLFNEYLYRLHPYQPHDKTLLFEKEKRIHKEELQTKVVSFMELLWKDKRDNQITSSGGGSAPDFGDSLKFWSGNSKKMFYEVEISVAGGHILRIYPAEDGPKKLDNGKLTSSEAKQLAQSLVTGWGEAPLVVDHTSTKGSILYVTFVPEIGGVHNTDAHLDVSIDMEKGILNYFDTTMYYLNKDRSDQVVAAVSPEEALKQVNDKMEVTGDPTLMKRDGKLVYSIAVKGYEKVTKVYINANTGKQVDIEYESEWSN